MAKEPGDVVGARPASLVGAAELLRQHEKIRDEKGIRLRVPSTGETDISPPLTPERKKDLALQRRLETITRKQAEGERSRRRRQKYYEKVNA